MPVVVLVPRQPGHRPALIPQLQLAPAWGRGGGGEQASTVVELKMGADPAAARACGPGSQEQASGASNGGSRPQLQLAPAWGRAVVGEGPGRRQACGAGLAHAHARTPRLWSARRLPRAPPWLAATQRPLSAASLYHNFAGGAYCIRQRASLAAPRRQPPLAPEHGEVTRYRRLGRAAARAHAAAPRLATLVGPLLRPAGQGGWNVRCEPAQRRAGAPDVSRDAGCHRPTRPGARKLASPIAPHRAPHLGAEWGGQRGAPGQPAVAGTARRARHARKPVGSRHLFHLS